MNECASLVSKSFTFTFHVSYTNNIGGAYTSGLGEWRDGNQVGWRAGVKGKGREGGEGGHGREGRERG